MDPLVIEYYSWLAANGGTAPRVLLKKWLTRSQRKYLTERMDDVNMLYSITTPLRRAAQATQKSREPQGDVFMFESDMSAEDTLKDLARDNHAPVVKEQEDSCDLFERFLLRTAQRKSL